MPWTIADVRRFTSRARTPAQRRRWVRVANDALARCIARGGNTERCEASAIRQANSVIANNQNEEAMPQLFTNILSFDASLIREERFQGREYLVAPVVMIVEGVLNRTLITGEAIRETHWAGIPITLSHPTIRNQPVSANSPMIRQDYQVGEVFNVRYDLQGMRGAQRVTRALAEAWIDVAQAQALGEDGAMLLDRLHSGARMEVSVGFFPGDVDQTAGIFQGARFDYSVAHLQADHLAILLHEQGACNWRDGCGFPRVHKDESMDEDQGMIKKMMQAMARAFSSIAEEDSEPIQTAHINGECNTTPCSCEAAPETHQTVSDIHRALYGAFAREQGVEVSDVIIEDVTENDEVIFRQGEHTRRRTFTMSDEGVIVLNDDEIDVQRDTRYLPVTASAEDQPEQGDASMANDAKVTEILTHPKTMWTEEQKAVLDTMSDEQLDAIITTCEAVPDREPKTETPKLEKMTHEQWLSTLSAEEREFYREATNEHKRLRESLVAALADRDVGFTAERLQTFTIKELKDLEAKTRPADYSLNHAFPGEPVAFGAGNDDWLPKD